jgi:chemotaxis protein CheX
MDSNEYRSPSGELEQIVASVFETMMGLEVRPHPADWNPDNDCLVATIRMTGKGNGVLVFEAGAEQSRALAGRFLSTDPPEKVDEDVRDVLGEIANMIGGNLKCVLPSGVKLSIPTVHNHPERPPDLASHPLERQVFACAEGPFRVSWTGGKMPDVM